MKGSPGTAKRVLFVAPSAYRLGGLATWLDYLLPGLRDRGWEPILGLVEGPRHNQPAAYLAEHPHERWIAIPCRTGTAEGRCRAVARAVGETDPDLVVGVNVPDAYHAVDRLRRADESSRVRALMTIHGILPQLFADARRFGDVLDGVAGTNRLACELAIRFGDVASDRVWYAPYGMDLPEELPPSIEPGGTLRIGFAGRLDRSQKRVLDLPAIAESLDRRGTPHRWRIAGTGPEEATLRDSLDPDRSMFLGHVPHAELAEVLYRRIDVLLVTSSWETGPMVAWEAMREGVPVVSSRYVGSGLEGSLRHGENALLFPVGDPDAAAGELARLFESADLRERLRAGGLRLLRERYGRETSVAAWERCFREILSRPPRAVGRQPEVPRADGRLGWWLPAGASETVRGALGRTAPDSGPGGEWPHSYGERTPLDEFLPRAAELDRRVRDATAGLAHGDRD